MNWEALWLSWPQRSLRELLVFPLIIFFLLFPIGLFSGTTPVLPASIPCTKAVWCACWPWPPCEAMSCLALAVHFSRRPVPHGAWCAASG